MKYPEIKARIIDIYPDDEQIKELVGKSLLLFCNDKLSTKFVARFIPASQKVRFTAESPENSWVPIGSHLGAKVKKSTHKLREVKKGETLKS